MKFYDWQRYLDEQRLVHDKHLFTVAELANVARTTPHMLNVELNRLSKRGLLIQYARGIYGLKGIVTPEMLLSYLDSRAYITAASALYYHGLITQVPVSFTCFTNRRHNRSRERTTPIALFVFVCVQKPIYCPPSKGIVASPEQALFDFVYMMRRKGAEPDTIVSFRHLERLIPARIERIGQRYPTTVRLQVSKILNSCSLSTTGIPQ